MQIRCGGSMLVVCVALLVAAPLYAHAPSGAIFTTLPDGSEVNFNHFDVKADVYLDGGPGIGAPQTAAGLDDGTYVFQVTNPNGKVLLSTDPARCRQFTVLNGIITGVVAAAGCEHLTGLDVDHGAATVQLCNRTGCADGFLDTPNNGGVYKAWVTRVEDFLLGCGLLGVANGLDVVDCGNVPGNRHGFIPSHSKTDNFKVNEEIVREIDARFFNAATGEAMDGLGITWFDTNGASNKKWSYFLPQFKQHEAHVEAVEDGSHNIVISDQASCIVGAIKVNGKLLPNAGPQIVEVRISGNTNRQYFIDVQCTVP